MAKAKNQSEAALPTIYEIVSAGAFFFEEADLAYGHGTDNAFDEAVWLTLDTLGLPVDDLESYLLMTLNNKQQQAVIRMFEERVATRKPAAYLLNKAYICGVPFYVDERVIVPRSFIGELLCSGKFDKIKPKSVLDLCTGSGCLAIIAAHIFKKAKVDAVDLSPGAIAVAKKNIAGAKMQKRIGLHKGDLFKPLKTRTYDLIITNPPYVDAKAMKELPPEYRYEPEMALASGKDGLDIVRRILKEAPKHLNKGGTLVCEIGRGRKKLEKEFKNIKFKWLNTANSEGEVFMLKKEQIKA